MSISGRVRIGKAKYQTGRLAGAVEYTDCISAEGLRRTSPQRVSKILH